MKPFHITKASVIIVIQLLVLSFLTLSLGLKSREAASETYFLSEQDDSAPPGEEKEKNFIRWVEENYPGVDWMTDIQTRYDLYNDYFYRSMSKREV